MLLIVECPKCQADVVVTKNGASFVSRGKCTECDSWVTVTDGKIREGLITVKEGLSANV